MQPNISAIPSVSLTYNGKVLGNGALTDGKLNVDLSGITETGALTLLASTVKNNVIYTFNVNVLLATKIIRNVEDLDVVKVTQTNIDNNTSIYGYYVLGNDINVKWLKPMMASLTYKGAVKNWETNFGFRGTFDGLGTRFRVLPSILSVCSDMSAKAPLLKTSSLINSNITDNI